MAKKNAIKEFVQVGNRKVPKNEYDKALKARKEFENKDSEDSVEEPEETDDGTSDPE